eukprot:m.6422 g.6422  ORF g.6422 m.6422 type:complete len:113 (+) comp2096_c0_seq1:230-568(+)
MLALYPSSCCVHAQSKFEFNEALDAFKNFKISETPCARTAYLQGIAFGSLIGVTRFVTSKIVSSACTFAVVGFAVSTAASFEYCLYERRKRVETVRKAVDELNALGAKKGAE